jgi:adenine phosphoribosyltransferase
LEYGIDTLEIHADACPSGSRVLIVDDVLATGGTACAAIRLIQKTGSDVTHIFFLLEIAALKGRIKIAQEFPEIKLDSLHIV